MGSEFTSQIEELHLQLHSTRRRWQDLLERSSALQQLLTRIRQRLRVEPGSRVEPIFFDWLDKLTGEEAWTLSLLSDSGGATPGNLEDLLGYSDPKHVLLSLAPLERFGLAEYRGGVWIVTRAGQMVAWLHRLRLKQEIVTDTH